MKADEFKVMEMAVERGVDYGFSRAHKHTGAPSEQQIKNEVCRAVMNEVCEWFKFEGEEQE